MNQKNAAKVYDYLKSNIQQAAQLLCEYRGNQSLSSLVNEALQEKIDRYLKADAKRLKKACQETNQTVYR